MRRPARPDLCLDERDVGELDVDDHLVPPGPDVGDLGRLEYLRRPELPYHHRAHARPPPTERFLPATSLSIALKAPWNVPAARFPGRENGLSSL